jgi:hypothetical protein
MADEDESGDRRSAVDPNVPGPDLASSGSEGEPDNGVTQLLPTVGRGWAGPDTGPPSVRAVARRPATALPALGRDSGVPQVPMSARATVDRRRRAAAASPTVAANSGSGAGTSDSPSPSAAPSAAGVPAGASPPHSSQPPPPSVEPSDTPPPVTLLSGGQPTATSALEDGGTLVGANAVDGNPATRWGSAWSDPQWITVDLGSVCPITLVRLSWEVAYGRSYQIQTSVDNTSWTTVFGTTSGDGGVDEVTVTATGRWVRVFGTQRATQWGYSLWELEVFGTGPSPRTA